MVMKGLIFFKVLGLFSNTVLCIENFILLKISSAKLSGLPCSKSCHKNCNFFNSNDSLSEFFPGKRKASPFTKPFLMLRGWHEEKCVCSKVSVGFKCV